MIEQTKDARASDTKRRLLDATHRCLARGGIPGTTAREIARESGVNLQGITYHFGSKDQLVSEALLIAIRGWIEPAIAVLQRDIDPIRRTVLAVRTLQKSFDDAQDLVPVYLEALLHARRDPAFAKSVQGLFRELHTFVSNQIAELRAKGSIPRWVDPKAMATLQIAAVDGVALHAALDPSGVDPRAVAAQGIRLLIAARKEPKKRKTTKRARKKGVQPLR